MTPERIAEVRVELEMPNERTITYEEFIEEEVRLHRLRLQKLYAAMSENKRLRARLQAADKIVEAYERNESVGDVAKAIKAYRDEARR